MRKFLVFFGVVFSTISLHSQINEIGLFFGGANLIGDIGNDAYIAPNKFAIGGLYKWNRSKRHSYRFGITYAEIYAKDVESSLLERKQRDIAAENYLLEFNAGLEFNFLNFDLHQAGFKWTPYIYSGIVYTGFNETFFLGTVQKSRFRNGAFGIPMIVGLKGKINNNWILGAEIGARYAFTDNLDGNKPKDENLRPLWFSNINSNDWYMFSGITLTYTFGENPCFCPGKK